MVRTKKSSAPGRRNERHSTAWGKRLSVAILLLTGLMFGQDTPAGVRGREASSRIHPEVAKIMARFAASPSQQVKVIVQYNQTPSTAALSRAQKLGGRVGHHLGVVRGAAFTVPAGSLQALANDRK